MNGEYRDNDCGERRSWADPPGWLCKPCRFAVRAAWAGLLIVAGAFVVNAVIGWAVFHTFAWVYGHVPGMAGSAAAEAQLQAQLARDIDGHRVQMQWVAFLVAAAVVVWELREVWADEAPPWPVEEWLIPRFVGGNR